MWPQGLGFSLGDTDPLSHSDKLWVGSWGRDGSRSQGLAHWWTTLRTGSGEAVSLESSSTGTCKR